MLSSERCVESKTQVFGVPGPSENYSCYQMEEHVKSIMLLVLRGVSKGLICFSLTCGYGLAVENLLG